MLLKEMLDNPQETLGSGLSALQSLASVLPKPVYLFLMLRFIGVQELDVVSLLCPFLVGAGKLAQQHILLLDGVQPGIVIGYDTGEEDGGQPKTEHDNLEPSTDVWRGKECPQVVPRQTKEQITGYTFQTCRAFRLAEDGGAGVNLPNHRSYGSFHNILVYDCHSWDGWLFPASGKPLFVSDCPLPASGKPRPIFKLIVPHRESPKSFSEPTVPHREAMF